MSAFHPDLLALGKAGPAEKATSTIDFNAVRSGAGALEDYEALEAKPKEVRVAAQKTGFFARLRGA